MRKLVQATLIGALAFSWAAVQPAAAQDAKAKKAKEWYLGNGKWEKTTEAQPIPADMKKVGADEIKAMIDAKKKVLLVDTRNAEEYKEGHLPKAVHLYDKDLASKKVKFPKDKATEMVIYCNGYPSCPRSLNAAKMAVEWGYKKVALYPDGYPDWQAKGFPVER